MASFVLGLAAVLIVSGLATLYWSQDLMRWLISIVGEERALGAGNVIHREGGGGLVTNPAAMVRWMLPFWLLGAIQIVSAVTLLWLRSGRRTGLGLGPRSDSQVSRLKHGRELPTRRLAWVKKACRPWPRRC